MSGHYRRMRSTQPALEAIAVFTAAASCRELLWLFDRPISNSGRLKQSLEELAADRVGRGKSSWWRAPTAT